VDPDRNALTAMSRSLRAWQRALGNAAAGGRVLEAGELAGSVVPAAPSRSLLNSAAAPHGSPLERDQIDVLADGYTTAGVTAWGVWLHEREHAAGELVADAGLEIDSEPTAMALDLAALVERDPDAGIEVERCEALAPLAEAAGAGYGFPAALLTDGMPRLLDHTEGWIARIGGAPAAGLVLVHEQDDAGVFMVATAPEHRRRGAARAAMQSALLDARGRGRVTSTLQSSEMGQPLYEQLGYRALGEYRLWERRSA
jgi:GNAT superfamily N-acetyltransferase